MKNNKITLVVQAEYNGSGIVDNQGNDIYYDDLNLPPDLALEFSNWVDWFHNLYFDSENFHMDFFEKRGLELAKKLKHYVNNLFRVVFHNQEIVLDRNGVPVILGKGSLRLIKGNSTQRNMIISFTL